MLMMMYREGVFGNTAKERRCIQQAILDLKKSGALDKPYRKMPKNVTFHWLD